MSIPLFVVSLKHRADRRKSIENELYDKSQFRFEVREAIESPVGSYGLWRLSME